MSADRCPACDRPIATPGCAYDLRKHCLGPVPFCVGTSVDWRSRALAAEAQLAAALSDNAGLSSNEIACKAEKDRLEAALDLAARYTSLAPEPCPLGLRLRCESEVCALHHQIDEHGFTLRKRDKRIAALEAGLHEARDWIADRSSPESVLVERLTALAEGTAKEYL